MLKKIAKRFLILFIEMLMSFVICYMLSFIQWPKEDIKYIIIGTWGLLIIYLIKDVVKIIKR